MEKTQSNSPFDQDSFEDFKYQIEEQSKQINLYSNRVQQPSTQYILASEKALFRALKTKYTTSQTSQEPQVVYEESISKKMGVIAKKLLIQKMQLEQLLKKHQVQDQEVQQEQEMQQ